MIIKKDGHTHSQFCRHGSKKPTRQSVQNAVRLHFTEISITEHAPLPTGYIEDINVYNAYNLQDFEIDPYLSHVHTLKSSFYDTIQVNVGFEFEYLPGQPDVTQAQIDELGAHCDDLILSLHFLRVNDKVMLMDYKPDMFYDGPVKALGGLYNTYMAYLREYMELIKLAGTLRHKPRLGHPMLIWKFSQKFPLTLEEQKEIDAFFIRSIIPEIAKNKLSVDYNVAGLDYADCKKTYLSDTAVDACIHANIPLVYGSDAHDPDHIGRHYSTYERHFQNA